MRSNSDLQRIIHYRFHRPYHRSGVAMPRLGRAGAILAVEIPQYVEGAGTDLGRHRGKPWRCEQRRLSVGQPLLPASAHGGSAEFVILPGALGIRRPVDELHDIHRGYATEVIEEFRFRRIPEPVGELVPKTVDVVADVVNLMKQIGNGAGLARIADVLSRSLTPSRSVGWRPRA
jgi:hypothetical protein